MMPREQIIVSFTFFLISQLQALNVRPIYQLNGLSTTTTTTRKTAITSLWNNATSGASDSTTIIEKEEDVRVKDILGDLPTPTLLVEMSLAEAAINKTLSSSKSLDDILRNFNNKEDDEDISHVLDGSIFIHTQVTDTSIRDQRNLEVGSGKSSIIATVDATPENHLPGGAYLGIGLSNHHVGGYYWARGMGIGASLEAHGVAFREVLSSLSSSSSFSSMETFPGELYWDKRNPSTSVTQGSTTDESSNSNDGKRSEWIDFVHVGDTVQIVPHNVSRVLLESKFQRLVGVRRSGRPLGADPIVERIWKRSLSTGSWVGL